MTELELIKFFLPKILVATLCGAIVGVEREVKDKAAGIRTNILICVGVTIMTSASFFYAITNPNIDFTRIIGQIITGVGFLGSGVIFKAENKVIGVTTASFIWIISAIGILVGSGIYVLPIILTAGLVIMSLILERLEKRIKKNNEN